MTKYSRRFLAIAAAVLLAGGGCVVWFAHQVLQVPKQAYAVWWTADLVIEHMEKHQGSWPRNWEELRTTNEQAYKGNVSTNRDGTWVAEFRPRASIDELQQLVEIDWTADPKQLAKAKFKEKGPPFRAIWLRNGRERYYSGKEPNTMVLEYLNSKQPAVSGAGL